MRRVCGSCAIGWGAVSEGFLRASQAACPFYSGRIGFLPGRRFAGTILFCQICPLTVRPSPMPDETEQPDRKTACSADLRFRFASCRRVYPPLSRRGAVRRLVPPVRPVRTLLGVPPFSFDAEEYLSGFETAHLIAARIEPGKRLRALCADAGQSEKQGRALLNEARCELDARLLALEEAWPDSRAFFAGTCFDCPEGTCTRPLDLPCVRPGKIRPSLEALGFDLGRTASELLGIELRWSVDGRLPEYFTLISGFFTNHSIDSLSW